MGNSSTKSQPAPTSAFGVRPPSKPIGVSTVLQSRTVQPSAFNVLRDTQTHIQPWRQSDTMGTMPTNQPKAIRAPEPSVYKGLDSYTLWKKSYLEHKVTPDHLAVLHDRIRVNSEAMRRDEMKTFELKLKRIEGTAKVINDIEPPKPVASLNSFVNVAARLKSFRLYDTKYFSSASKRPELTKDMLDRIEDVSNLYPSNQLLAEIDGVQILRKDIATLTDCNWLNDEVVNGYMNLLVMRGGTGNFKKVHTFNTFFYPKLRDSGYSSVRRWTRKVDIFSFDFVLVPVHLGNHWCLAFIDFTKRTVSYYDSLGGGNHGCCDILMDYLRQESLDKKKQNFDDENWRIVDTCRESIPRQKNGYDCGVFACTYAEHLTRQAKLSFKQEDMPYFRKKMIYEIVTKQILG